MKTNTLTLRGLFMISFAALALLGCRDKNVQERTYTANVPIYMSPDEFRSAVASEDAKPITKAGKIFFKDNFLFINNREEGIHVIDNRDPSAPVNLAYIKIPGNRELAISGNRLFADSYTDLVILDVTDPTNVSEIGRESAVFPMALPKHDPAYRVQQPDPSQGVVIGWKLETVTEVVENGNAKGGFVDLRWDDDLFVPADEDPLAGDRASFGVDQSQVRSAISGGKSGSMAGFVLHENNLYALSGMNILVFETRGTSATKVATVATERNAETLFPFGENLFVGTSNGMIIYSLIDPSNPKYQGVFEHAESCDPVAVEGNYAYVTLRSGTNCGGWSNQLDIIDISDLKSPKLVSTTGMTNPFGLAIDEQRIFVCEGYSGIKVMDATDPNNPSLITQFTDQSAMDVITYNGVLMMIGQDGLYQYDFSDINNMTLLSSIATN